MRSRTSADEGTYPLDLSKVPTERYEWNEWACDVMHFDKRGDSPSPYFHSVKQLKLFRGGLDTRDMYNKHRRVSWMHMQHFPQMETVVNYFDAMGVRAMMELHQDWNEMVIRQFYATVEVSKKKEKLIWMTGTRRLEASFSDLAEACRLDYHFMKQGKIVDDLEEPQNEEVRHLHYQAASEYGPIGGLRRIPRVMLKLLKRTVLPDDDDDETELASPWYELIMAMMSGQRLNIVEFMVEEMMTNRRDVDSPLIYQPYIMALVLRKVTDFRGFLEIEHRSYQTYNCQREVLERAPSPMPSPGTNLLCQESLSSSSSAGPQPIEVDVIEISSDTAQSVASGAGSWSPGRSVGSHVSGHPPS